MTGSRPGPLGEPTVEDRVEVRVTGQPNPMVDDLGQEVGTFPPYDFTFRTDRDTWRHAAGIAARAMTQWTDGAVQMRRVRVETRTSDWAPVAPGDLDDDTEEQR